MFSSLIVYCTKVYMYYIINVIEHIVRFEIMFPE